MKRRKEEKEALVIPETKELIIGWNNAQEVADSVCSLSHRTLLYGNLLFAYKCSDIQVVISRYPDGYFGVSTACPGYTALIPHTTRDYIDVVVIPDLEKCKTNKEFIEYLKNNL